MAEVEKEDYLGVFKKIHNRNIAKDPENQTCGQAFRKNIWLMSQILS